MEGGNTLMAWYKDDKTGNWTATDNSGKTVQDGYVADSKGLAHISNGTWDGTYKDNTPTGSNSNLSPYDYTNDIKALGEAQTQSAISALTKAYQQNVSNLGAERAKIEPTYYKKRNDESTSAKMASRNFAEYMANRGQVNSGTNNQASLANNIALQGNLGTLASGEAQAYTDNDKQLADLQNAYQSDLAAAQSGGQATMMQNLINARQQYEAAKLAQANADRAFNYQVGRDTIGDTGKLANGDYTLAGQTAMSNIAAQNAGIDYTKAQTVYQNLVNQGYPAQQAADLALKWAQVSNVNKSTSLMGSGGSSSSSDKADATAKAMDYMNAMARGEVTDSNGNKVRADRNDILNWIQKASGQLTRDGVNVSTLTNWADNTFQWER